MCIYGEYGICSLCPQEECPEKEKIMNISVSQQIKELKNVKTFWDDVKKIIPPAYADWQIKKWQAEAEEQYHKLEFLNKWTDLLGTWTKISFTYAEVETITDYFKQNKKSVIKEINEL